MELRKLASTYNEYDPEKRKRDADRFRAKLLQSFGSITERLSTEFGSKVLIRQLSPSNRQPIDGMQCFSYGIQVSVKGIAGGYQVRMYAHPIDIDNTKIGYGGANFKSNFFGAVNEIEIENKNSNRQVADFRNEISYYVIKQFIQTFSDKINNLKLND